MEQWREFFRHEARPILVGAGFGVSPTVTDSTVVMLEDLDATVVGEAGYIAVKDESHTVRCRLVPDLYLGACIIQPEKSS